MSHIFVTIIAPISADISCYVGQYYGNVQTARGTEIAKGNWVQTKICHIKGAGSAVFESAMKWAEDHGARRLFIISNSRLSPALHIYEKYGFKEIKLDDYEYECGDIAFEKVLK